MQQAEKNFRRGVGLLGLATIFVAAGYYWLLLWKLAWITDVQLHVGMLQKVLRGQGSVPANFGFYEVVRVASGFSDEPGRLLAAAIGVIGLAWGALVVVSGYGGRRLWQTCALGEPETAPGVVLLLAAAGSCLLFPLPASGEGWYLGLLPPNVYHNSTIICALPFSVLAFVLGVKRLAATRPPALADDLALSLVLVIGAVFKPSYAFAFLPAYAGLFVRQFGLHLRALGRLAVALLPVLLVIAGQLLWTRQHPHDTLYGASTLALGWPAGWRTFVPDFGPARVAACAASSLLVPVAAYALRPVWLRRQAHQLALGSLLAGLLLFLLVHETGLRARHGNFIWQVVAASHVLHWLILLEGLAWVPADAGQSRRKKLLLGLLAIEVVSGAVYLVSSLFRGVYQ
ncbi:MAG: hypothetical protein M3Y54_11220 [Bacteroidota bacterium]|nr:hypothetical protein [Bacteroidota bacterium]